MNLQSVRFVGLMLAVGFILTAGVAQAGFIPPPDDGWWDQDYKWCPDPSNDAEGGSSYEVLGMGYAITGNYLVVCVDTNFPIEGLTGRDSYNNSSHFSPGDLYINVGGMFQMGNGSVWGVATTTNPGGVDRTSDPNDGPWFPILDAGDLFYGAQFATGTHESYDTGTPSDGNDGDGANDYPTLITSYQVPWSVNQGFSGFHYDAVNTDYYYFVDLALMNNLEGGNLLNSNGALATSIQLSWSMECGNDLVEYKIQPEIPEPATVALIAAGAAAMAARRRKGVL